jgi:hypothetical protein
MQASAWSTAAYSTSPLAGVHLAAQHALQRQSLSAPARAFTFAQVDDNAETRKCKACLADVGGEKNHGSVRFFSCQQHAVRVVLLIFSFVTFHARVESEDTSLRR